MLNTISLNSRTSIFAVIGSAIGSYYAFTAPEYSFLIWFSFTPFLFAVNCKNYLTAVCLSILFTLIFIGGLAFGMAFYNIPGYAAFIVYRGIGIIAWISALYFSRALIKRHYVTAAFAMASLWACLEYAYSSLFGGHYITVKTYCSYRT